jgi:hypothetical protein
MSWLVECLLANTCYNYSFLCCRRMCGTRVRVEMSSGRSRRGGGGGGGGGGRRGSAPTRYSRYVASLYHTYTAYRRY